MYRNMTVGVVIPALNEEASIGLVVGDLLAQRNAEGSPLVDDIVVCDNGSSDETAARAIAGGARVVVEPQPGYGRACLAALDGLKPADIVVFTDGDHAFRAAQLSSLLERFGAGADLVIGSRTLGLRERGALTRGQMVGNRVAGILIRLLWRRRITDLGPYRAIRAEALSQLGMVDTAFGWTAEMQVKAIQHGLRVVEVPVDTRARIGESKISGTLRGSFAAGLGILSMIAKLRWRQYRCGIQSG